MSTSWKKSFLIFFVAVCGIACANPISDDCRDLVENCESKKNEHGICSYEGIVITLQIFPKNVPKLIFIWISVSYLSHKLCCKTCSEVKLTKEDLPMERPKNFQIPDWDDVKFDKNSKKMIYKIPSHRRPSDIAAPSELNSI